MLILLIILSSTWCVEKILILWNPAIENNEWPGLCEIQEYVKYKIQFDGHTCDFKAYVLKKYLCQDSITYCNILVKPAKDFF
jgi:hypothetical protein